MSREHDDSIRQRIDDEEALDQSTRAPTYAEGPRRVAGRTKSEGHYPTIPGVMYAVEQYALGGDETEGGAGTETATGIIYHALHLGAKAPPEGTKVTISSVPDRWVFTYNG